VTLFVATLRFMAVVGDDAPDAPLLEDAIWIVPAENADAARHAATVIGQREQHEYRNEAGDLVEWKFVEVKGLEDLGVDKITEPLEISSCLFRRSAS
jgi:hypothetical protein